MTRPPCNQTRNQKTRSARRPSFVSPSPKQTFHSRQMSCKSSSEEETRRQSVDRVPQSRMSDSDQPFAVQDIKRISLDISISPSSRVGKENSPPVALIKPIIAISRIRTQGKMTGLLLQASRTKRSALPPSPVPPSSSLASRILFKDSLSPRRDTRNARHGRLGRPYGRF